MEKKLVILHKHEVYYATAKKVKDNENCFIINGFIELSPYQEIKVDTNDTLFAFYCQKCKDSSVILPKSNNYQYFFISHKNMENLRNDFNQKGMLEKVYFESNPDINIIKQKDKNDFFEYIFCEISNIDIYEQKIYIGTKEEKQEFFKRNFIRLSNQGKGIYFKVDTDEVN